jgi:polysaccharide biosynthesis transport protein
VELAEYVSILLRRWRVAVASALLGAVIAGVLSMMAPPSYVARTEVLFSVASGGSARDLNRGSAYTRALVASYAELTTQPTVLSIVIRRLALPRTYEQLADAVTVTASQDTALVTISVADPSPRRSAAVADAIAARLAELVPTLAPRTASAAVPIVATVVTPAAIPSFRSAPKTKQNVALGIIIGGVLGLGLSVVRHRIDVRISDTEAVRITGAPVLGSLRAPADARRGRLAALLGRPGNPDSDLEQLRTTFQHLRLHEGYRTVVLTSPVDGSVSSASALDLGRTLSRVGTRVLLVDADLQDPKLTRSCGRQEDDPGLSSVLAEGVPWQLAVFGHGDPPVTVLGAGPPPYNPDLVLEASSTESVLRRAARRYDVLVISAPPVLRIADTLLLSRIADGVVLVADRRRTSRDDLTEGFASLDVVGARVLGVVLRD